MIAFINCCFVAGVPSSTFACWMRSFPFCLLHVPSVSGWMLFPHQLVEEAGAVSGSGSGLVPSLFLGELLCSLIPTDSATETNEQRTQSPEKNKYLTALFVNTLYL